MKLQDIIIWILFILSLAVAGWYLFGNSPTFEQSILIFMLSLLFVIGFKINSIGWKLNYLEKRFNLLAHDFKENIK